MSLSSYYKKVYDLENLSIADTGKQFYDISQRGNEHHILKQIFKRIMENKRKDIRHTFRKDCIKYNYFIIEGDSVFATITDQDEYDKYLIKFTMSDFACRKKTESGDKLHRLKIDYTIVPTPYGFEFDPMENVYKSYESPSKYLINKYYAPECAWDPYYD